MIDVTRYDPVQAYRRDGLYVDASDYDALAAQLAALREAAGKAADYLDTSATCNSDKAMAAMLRALLKEKP